jgi:hypothetical protein
LPGVNRLPVRLTPPIRREKRHHRQEPLKEDKKKSARYHGKPTESSMVNFCKEFLWAFSEEAILRRPTLGNFFIVAQESYSFSIRISLSTPDYPMKASLF